MRWWLKARRAQTLLLGALAAYLTVLALLGDGTVALPSLFNGGGSPVPWVLTAPVPLCGALMLSLESGLGTAENASFRRVRQWDAALVVALTVAAFAGAWAVGSALGTAETAAAGRNAAFLIGLALTVRVVAGPQAVMAPLLWLLAVVFFGFDAGGRPQPWTVLPLDAADPKAAGATAAAFAVGLGCLLARTRQHHDETGH